MPGILYLGSCSDSNHSQTVTTVLMVCDQNQVCSPPSSHTGGPRKITGHWPYPTYPVKSHLSSAQGTLLSSNVPLTRRINQGDTPPPVSLGQRAACEPKVADTRTQVEVTEKRFLSVICHHLSHSKWKPMLLSLF